MSEQRTPAFGDNSNFVPVEGSPEYPPQTVSTQSESPFVQQTMLLNSLEANTVEQVSFCNN